MNVSKKKSKKKYPIWSTNAFYANYILCIPSTGQMHSHIKHAHAADIN